MGVKRPDLQEIYDLRVLVQDCDKTLDRLRTFHDDARETIKEKLQAYRLVRADRQLDDLSVNTFRSLIGKSKCDLLMQEGLMTVMDIHRTGKKELIALNGIGKVTAEKIKDAAEEIVTLHMREVPIRIEAEIPTAEEENLVRSVYVYYRSKQLSEKAQKYYGEAHKTVSSVLEETDRIRGKIAWFFAPKQKKESFVQSCEELKKLWNGQYAETAEEMRREQESLQNTEKEILKKEFAENAASYYALLESLSETELQKEDLGENELEVSLVQEIQAYPLNTDHLQVILRPYQTFGVKYILYQKKVLLGDEMGLGKTIEALAVMGDLYSQGRRYFLVVCPTGIMANWMREIQNRTDLPATMIHGQIVQKTREWQKSGGIAVTNYESLYRIVIPEDTGLDMITADEAHYVKNPEAQRTQALRRLQEKAEYVLYMTGTPLENKVEEMAGLIGYLRPDIGENIRDMTWFAEAPAFRREIAPVYLRRKREEVLPELPELTEISAWCTMNPSEYLAYFAAVEAGDLSDMRRVSWNAGESAKAERLLEICLQAREEGRKVLVFSYFLDTIAVVRDLLEGMAGEPITGAMSSTVRQAVIDEFEQREDRTALIAQIEAAGFGLNIQSASIVVLCEPQLKPSLEDQAISRAYRMGQVHNVLVYRLLSEGSIDEYLTERLGRKREIFEDFADTSAMQEALSTDSAWIREMIEEERKRCAKTEDRDDA